MEGSTVRSVTDEYEVNCVTSLHYKVLIRRMEPFTSQGYLEHDLGLVGPGKQEALC